MEQGRERAEEGRHGRPEEEAGGDAPVERDMDGIRDRFRATALDLAHAADGEHDADVALGLGETQERGAEQDTGERSADPVRAEAVAEDEHDHEQDEGHDPDQAPRGSTARREIARAVGPDRTRGVVGVQSAAFSSSASRAFARSPCGVPSYFFTNGSTFFNAFFGERSDTSAISLT